MAAEYVANPAMVKELSERIGKNKIGTDTSVTISGSWYTVLTDGYFVVRCNNVAGNYEYGYMLNSYDNDSILILTAASLVNGGVAMQGYPVNAMFIRKGTQIRASGNGEANFYPLR